MSLGRDLMDFTGLDDMELGGNIFDFSRLGSRRLMFFVDGGTP